MLKTDIFMKKSHFSTKPVKILHRSITTNACMTLNVYFLHPEMLVQSRFSHVTTVLNQVPALKIFYYAQCSLNYEQIMNFYKTDKEFHP